MDGWMDESMVFLYAPFSRDSSRPTSPPTTTATTSTSTGAVVEPCLVMRTVQLARSCKEVVSKWCCGWKWTMEASATWAHGGGYYSGAGAPASRRAAFGMLASSVLGSAC